MVYVGKELFGAKWRNWKILTKELEKGTDEIKHYDFPHVINLYDDPKELYSINNRTPEFFWVRWPIGEYMKRHMISLKMEPPIPEGTPDPYAPQKMN